MEEEITKTGEETIREIQARISEGERDSRQKSRRFTGISMRRTMWMKRKK
ncbi:hypothetical protein [Oribacterium sp. oral taxon 078]|nr:hypothetical protein [Oribacterium sp. oral taxon 078]